MAATYKSFLAAPDSSMLADDATLHYLTTTTSFRGANDIVKHLKDSKQVKKQSQDIINVIDGGQSTIAVEVDTGIEFQSGGGVYLPGIDDAFLASGTMQFPTMHIVSFNAQGKISQIRQQWDQGSLLKQAEIIGKSGRNWPIRDGKDQITFIKSCYTSSGPAPSQTSTNPRGGVSNAMRDPHASLQLFGSREEIDSMPLPEVRTPFGGQRPKQRAPTDFITDRPDYDEDAPEQSPSKGGMRGVQPIRIFEGHEEYIEPEEDEKPKEKLPHIRAHPLKYKHFELSDTPAGQPDHAVPSESPYTVHDSQWGFEDFTKPINHTPMRRMRQEEFENGRSEDSSAALGNITNFNGRGKDAADQSPSNASPSKGTSDSLNRAFQKMDINGNAIEETSAAQKENFWTQQANGKEDKRIHIAGDGMGGRKGAGRNFLSDGW